MKNLQLLAEQWKTRSARRFQDAKNEPDYMGSRLIRHGAFIYNNCANELLEIINQENAPTTLPKENQSDNHV